MKVLAILCSVLLGAGLASGCLGGTGSKKDNQTGNSTVPSTAPQGTVTADTCALAGAVVDEDSLPVPEARVELVSYARSATTALDGSYSFSLLDPRAYQLKATKVDYLPSAVASAECKAGEEATVPLITLKPLPASAKPEPDPVPVMQGRFGCVVSTNTGLPGASTSRLDPGASNFPGGGQDLPTCGRSVTQLRALPRANRTITGAVFELQWSSAEKLEFKMAPAGPANASHAEFVESWWKGEWSNNTKTLIGTSPLNISFALKSVHPANVTEALPWGNFTFEASTHADGPADTHTTVSLNFQVYVTFFYNGYPVPRCWKQQAEC